MVEQTEAIRVQLQFEADQAEKRAKTMDRQLKRLENRFDPLSRATKRYEAGVKTLEKNLESGNIDLARYEKNLEGLNREFDAAKVKAAGAGAAVANMNRPASGLAGVMNRNKTAFQQAGYQIGDFAVQVQGGQSAITAFTQQGSQMLGVFGAYGAIAGAALAIGAPLVASFVSGGVEAEEYADIVERLKEAIDAYSSAADLANLSTEELAEKFGATSEALRPTLQLLAELKQQTALTELATAAAAFSDEFSEMFANLDAIMSMSDAQRELTKHLEDAAFGFGLTLEQALSLRAALDDIGAATGPEEVSQAARDLYNVLLDAYGALENFPPEFREIAQAAAEADVSASELQGTIEDSVFTVADLVSSIYAIDFSNAIAGAQSMLGVLQQAWATAASLAQQRLDQAAFAGRGRGADPRSFDDGSGSLGDQYGFRAQLSNTYTSPATTARRSSRSSGGASGGGSGAAMQESRELANAQREAERVIESLKSEVENYNEELAKLADLNERGLLTTKQLEQAQGELRAEMIDARWEETGLSTFVDDLANAAVNAENLGDVIVDQLKRMAAEWISSGLTDIGKSFISGGGSGGGSGLVGSLIGGMFGGFRENGGPVSKGKSYIVGEAGPELFTPPSSGNIVPNGALSGGQTVTYNIDARGATEGTADMIVRKIREAAPAIQEGATQQTLKYMSETTQGWG